MGTGQLSPENCPWRIAPPPRTIVLRIIAPGQLPSRVIAPQIVATPEIVPEIISPWTIGAQTIAPQNK